MTTSPSEISATYVPKSKYKNFSCDELSQELSSLGRRETQLVMAQKQRAKNSRMQAFLLGFGRGDGVEAVELANVKGEREAAHSALEKKACNNESFREKVEAEKLLDSRCKETFTLIKKKEQKAVLKIPSSYDSLKKGDTLRLKDNKEKEISLNINEKTDNIVLVTFPDKEAIQENYFSTSCE